LIYVCIGVVGKMNKNSLRLGGVGIVVVAAGCYCFFNRDISAPRPETSPAATLTTDAATSVPRSAVLQRVAKRWRIYAETSGGTRELINAGEQLLTAELEHHLPETVTIPERFDTSLDRLLLSQKVISGEKNQQGKIRCVALWILNMTPQTPLDKDAIAKQFNEVIDDFTKALSANLHNCIAGREGYEEIIRENVESAKTLCQKITNELAVDPLFPAFKRVLTEEQMRLIRQYCESRKPGSVFDPYPGLGDAQLYYKKNLARQTHTETRLFLEEITLKHAIPILDKNRWWGQCMWSTSTQGGDIFRDPFLWPFVGAVSPAPAVFQNK
jgi:hypothetical protein